MKAIKAYSNNRTLLLLLALLVLTVISGYSQECPGNQIAVKIQNIKNPNPNTLEFDVYVSNTGSTALSLAALQGSLIYDNRLIPTGASTTFTKVNESNDAFSQFNSLITNVSKETNQLRWTQSPVSLSSQKTVYLPTNKSIKFARFRLTSSQPLATQYSSKLSPQTTTYRGLTKMLATVYCNESQSSVGIVPRNANDNPNSVNFSVLGNPNPFKDQFKISINTFSDATVELKTYNMVGKLIEVRNINPEQIENLEMGANYAAGIYNIVVTQNAHNETIRMIKQ